MADEFRTIDCRELKDNPFKLIANDWMLVTAGDIQKFNTMTASWGAMGELWNKKVCFCFVRPTRYTYEFMNTSDNFTLSFFDEYYRPVLDFFGRVSGRDVDKPTRGGMTPATTESGAVYFTQARLVIECRKIYTADIDPALFLDPIIKKSYPMKDYHRMFVGEIVKCLVK
jgi:flavin reductase (DIM6/NTAB) family NADH-FMN oxidoreductase RutF